MLNSLKKFSSITIVLTFACSVVFAKSSDGEYGSYKSTKASMDSIMHKKMKEGYIVEYSVVEHKKAFKAEELAKEAAEKKLRNNPDFKKEVQSKENTSIVELYSNSAKDGRKYLGMVLVGRKKSTSPEDIMNYYQRIVECYESAPGRFGNRVDFSYEPAKDDTLKGEIKKYLDSTARQDLAIRIKSKMAQTTIEEIDKFESSDIYALLQKNQPTLGLKAVKEGFLRRFKEDTVVFNTILDNIHKISDQQIIDISKDSCLSHVERVNSIVRNYKGKTWEVYILGINTNEGKVQEVVDIVKKNAIKDGSDNIGKDVINALFKFLFGA